MFVAMVTAPAWPASVMMPASRSWFLALRMLWGMPWRVSMPASRSEDSTDAVPTSTGCPWPRALAISSTAARNLAASLRKIRSAWSSRRMGALVGITMTSSE